MCLLFTIWWITILSTSEGSASSRKGWSTSCTWSLRKGRTGWWVPHGYLRSTAWQRGRFIEEIIIIIIQNHAHQQIEWEHQKEVLQEPWTTWALDSPNLQPGSERKTQGASIVCFSFRWFGSSQQLRWRFQSLIWKMSSTSLMKMMMVPLPRNEMTQLRWFWCWFNVVQFWCWMFHL